MNDRIRTGGCLCGAVFEGGVEIFLGTLDDAPHGITPGLEVWTIRREPWLPHLPGIDLYEQNPP